MTIYFVGGEDSDFQNVGGCLVSGSSGFRSQYARCALAVGLGQGLNTSVPMASFWNAANVFAASNFWFSARCNDGSVGLSYGTTMYGFLVRFADAAGIPRLQIAGAQWAGESTGTFNLQTINAAGVVTTLATSQGGFASNYAAKMDIQINYTTSGSFTWYVDSYPLLSYTGNITTDGATQLAGFALGMSAQGTGIAGAAYWSEIIIADSDTRSLALQTLVPNSAGTLSQWIGDGTSGSINELTLNDLNGITSATVGQVELFTQNTGTIMAPFVLGVAVSARAVTTPGQPQHLELALGESGSVHTSPSLAVNTAFRNAQYVWTADPATGAAWTSIANVQIGVKSIA